ncbi:MAG: YkvA family protein [Brachymonas sp.]|nr:YkvA family protein [Brachymonas sp.]
MPQAGNYSERDFWGKAFGFARVAGRQVVHKALLLYYAAQNPRTPKWAKTAIYGALAYFVMPIDAIPDILPGIGYTDDLGMLALALATVSLYVNDDVRRKTAQRLQAWFGPETIEDITPRAAAGK